MAFAQCILLFLLSHHLYQPQRHCSSATHPGSPVSDLIQDPRHIVHHSHQRSTGQKVRSLVGCQPKETPHWSQVTFVVCSGACYDSTYAGRHLLCPLLTTVLTKLRSQTERASSPESRRPLHPFICLPLWTLWCWGLWSELPQARKEVWTPRLRSPWEHGMKGCRSWEIVFYYAMIDEDEDNKCWCCGGL